MQPLLSVAPGSDPPQSYLSRSATPTPTPGTPRPPLSASALLERLHRLSSLIQRRPELLSSRTPLHEEISTHIAALEKWLDAPISQSKETDGVSLFEDESEYEDGAGEDGSAATDGTGAGDTTFRLSSKSTLPDSKHPETPIFLQPTPISPPLSSRSALCRTSLDVRDESTVVSRRKSLQTGSAHSGTTGSQASDRSDSPSLDPLISRLTAAAATLQANYDRIVALNDNLVARLDKFASDSMRQQTESDRLHHTVQFQRSELLWLKMQLECYANGFVDRSGVDAPVHSLDRTASPSPTDRKDTHPPNHFPDHTTSHGNNDGNTLLIPAVSSSRPGSHCNSPALKPVSSPPIRSLPFQPSACGPSTSPSAPSLILTQATVKGRSPTALSYPDLGISPSSSSAAAAAAPSVRPPHRQRQSIGGGVGGWSKPRSTRNEVIKTYIRTAGDDHLSPLPTAVKPRPIFLSRRTASVDNPRLPYLELDRASARCAMMAVSDEAGADEHAGAPAVNKGDTFSGVAESAATAHQNRGSPVRLPPRNHPGSGSRADPMSPSDEDAVSRELADEVNRADVESHASDAGIHSNHRRRNYAKAGADGDGLDGGARSQHYRSESSDWWGNTTPCPTSRRRRFMLSSSRSSASPTTPRPGHSSTSVSNTSGPAGAGEAVFAPGECADGEVVPNDSLLRRFRSLTTRAADRSSLSARSCSSLSSVSSLVESADEVAQVIRPEDVRSEYLFDQRDGETETDTDGGGEAERQYDHGEGEYRDGGSYQGGSSPPPLPSGYSSYLEQADEFAALQASSSPSRAWHDPVRYGDDDDDDGGTGGNRVPDADADAEDIADFVAPPGFPNPSFRTALSAASGSCLNRGGGYAHADPRRRRERAIKGGDSPPIDDGAVGRGGGGGDGDRDTDSDSDGSSAGAGADVREYDSGAEYGDRLDLGHDGGDVLPRARRTEFLVWDPSGGMGSEYFESGDDDDEVDDDEDDEDDEEDGEEEEDGEYSEGGDSGDEPDDQVGTTRPRVREKKDAGPASTPFRQFLRAWIHLTGSDY